MRRPVLFAGISAVLLLSALANAESVQQGFDTYCVRCHGEKLASGKVRLDTISRGENMELTRRIVRVLSDGIMPPKGQPQPSQTLRQLIVKELEGDLNKHLTSSGRLSPVVMRRLNRYEYNNAVHDLLRLKGDIYPLNEKTIRAHRPYYDPASGEMPQSVLVGCRPLGHKQLESPVLSGVTPFAIDLQAEHGFNNRGSDLGVSPLLLESFLGLSQSIVNSPEFNDYSEAYQELFVYAGDDPATVARERLVALLDLAFRGNVDASTLDRYAGYFRDQYEQTKSFESSMKSVVAAALASPRFLYLVERKPSDQGAVEPLTGKELATRLSFFLWSTIPDQELLALARDDELTKPTVLEAQVNRMLLDPRSQALSTNFARQWLRLDQLTTATPDLDRFATFYAKIGDEHWKLGALMMIEPLLLFETIVLENRSILELVDSDYSYRNDTLQRWYDDANAFAERKEMGRYKLAEDEYSRRKLDTRRQGGVITTAAVMTMTSTPLRTSPIVRGSWVAGVILNRPPLPPPDDIPDIEADDEAIAAMGLTLRQRLEQHQVNDTCRSCHATIDPLGFALENYDSVGHWRDTYVSGLRVDAGGELFGRIQFRDVAEFKDALLADPTIFYRAFSEHLFSYALGRELEPTDKPDIDHMVSELEANNGRFSSLIHSITMSKAFRHKAGPR